MRARVGSSSSFTVGLLHALHALRGRVCSKAELAAESIHVEQEILKEAVGSQDQVSASHGGLNHILFLPNGEISARPLTISRERMRELNAHLLLFYTGIKRTAAQIAESFVTKIEDKRRQLRIMKDLVDESISILTGEHDITAFGQLLEEAWQAKRSLSSSVTNQHVDQIYDLAIAAGAMAGKLTGAGGGGFLLLFVPPERHTRVREALREFVHVPFSFEFSGSQIIFYDVEADYTAEDRDRVGRSIRVFRELTAVPLNGDGAAEPALRRKAG
jgi:D-glycero-alpha-D-manno-heptose-7-phosphate kinase